MIVEGRRSEPDLNTFVIASPPSNSTPYQISTPDMVMAYWWLRSRWGDEDGNKKSPCFCCAPPDRTIFFTHFWLMPEKSRVARFGSILYRSVWWQRLGNRINFNWQILLREGSGIRGNLIYWLPASDWNWEKFEFDEVVKMANLLIFFLLF